MTEEQVTIEFTKKVKRGMFNPVQRHLTDPTLAEDRLQDAICQTWRMYRSYALDKGKVLDDGILVHSCRQRATDLARAFVPAGGRQQSLDVMSPVAYRAGKVEVLRLDGINLENDNDLPWCPQVGWAEEEALRPERNLNSALDLEAWLGDLTHRDRHLLEAKAAGIETTKTAADLDLPYGVAYRRGKELGKELAARAGVRIRQSRRSASTARS